MSANPRGRQFSGLRKKWGVVYRGMRLSPNLASSLPTQDGRYISLRKRNGGTYCLSSQYVDAKRLKWRRNVCVRDGRYRQPGRLGLVVFWNSWWVHVTLPCLPKNTRKCTLFRQSNGSITLRWVDHYNALTTPAVYTGTIERAGTMEPRIAVGSYSRGFHFDPLAMAQAL